MKTRFSFLLLIALFFSSCQGQTKQALETKTENPIQKIENGFAVVELFTSQGCSSCPPADANLTRISEAARKNNKKVYALAFHVDYWNRLGWSDPFSKAEFSKRQSLYSNALNLQGSYTPQIIINGETEFVGSNRNKSDEVIEEYLVKEPSFNLTLGSPSTIDGKIGKIPYRIDGDIQGKKLCVALVENGKITKIPKGENSGKILKNDCVVIWFDQITPDQAGNINLPEKQVLNKKNVELIVFLQEEISKKILAANGVVL